MEKIVILPTGAEEGISAVTRKASFSMQELMKVLEKHHLPATIEQAIKVLAQPTYLRDEAVAEAEAYAKRTKAPQVVRDRTVADAYNSIDPNIINDLSKAVDNWVSPFTPADFEINEFDAWVLSSEAVEQFTETHKISIEGEDLELAQRLRAFIVEYKALCKVFDVSSLPSFIPDYDTPPIESFCSSVVSARQSKEGKEAFDKKMQERKERKRAKILSNSELRNNGE